MKIILNTATSYEGKPLKIGDMADLPLNIAQRWINKGIAHLPERVEEIKPVEIKVEEPEEVIFREPEIGKEVDIEFEPLPEVIEEEIKPKRKTKKKKIDEDNS